MLVNRCRLPVVVLGTGSIGARHLHALRKIDDAEPVAVPIRPNCTFAWTRLGFCTVGSLEQAAAQGARHAIIATETARHGADAELALSLGFDVLVEKPMATSAREAQRVWQLANSSNHQVFVGCNLRFNDSLGAFRSALPQIGPIHSARIECQSYLPEWRPGRAYQETYSARAADGGVLRDLIHEIDYAGWLFGWPDSLRASVRNLGRLGIAADEMADLSWELAGGQSVSIHLDYLTRPARRLMRASGAAGTVEWNAIDATTTVSLVGMPPVTTTSSQTRDDTYVEQDRAFLEALGAVRDDRLARGSDGILALAVCDAARAASAQRREIEVRYP